MGRWGRCDYSQLQNLQRKIQMFESIDIDRFVRDCSKELTARLLSKVIKRTPVGDYDKGRVGGTLRRGWTAKTHEEAESGGNKNATRYVSDIQIIKSGDTYKIELINPVKYASYVEFGHRTRNHKGWVPGQFMMTISAQEIENQAPKIIQKKLERYLKECFDA